MKKNYFLFDLDGTISDPKIGITKSVQYSLEAFGIHVENPDDLVAFIGPPLRDSYKKFYSFDDTQAELAVAKYREYFAEIGIFENTLYPGMRELLKRQHAQGRIQSIATSKPTVYAKAIIKHFALEPYFAFIAGSELDGARSNKAEVIQYAMDTLGITSARDAVMIGDRKHDVLGANTHGMDSIGVLFGYGNRRELADAGATYITDTVDNLSNLLNTL